MNALPNKMANEPAHCLVLFTHAPLSGKFRSTLDGPDVGEDYKNVRQCASETIATSTLFDCISIAFSIFRPHEDCAQLSVAYSPITRNAVDLFSGPAVAPKLSTAASHSRRFPYVNVPVKVNRFPKKDILGGGVSSGSVVARSNSPTSKSLAQRELSVDIKSARSSSSTIPSLRASESLLKTLDNKEFEVELSEAASHFNKYSISKSFNCPSATRPRANPISSEVCRSMISDFLNFNLSEGSVIKNPFLSIKLNRALKFVSVKVHQQKTAVRVGPLSISRRSDTRATIAGFSMVRCAGEPQGSPFLEAVGPNLCHLAARSWSFFGQFILISRRAA